MGSPLRGSTNWKEALVLGASAVLVFAGAFSAKKATAPEPAASVEEPEAEIPPLPPGAAIPFDEPPTASEGGCRFVDPGFGDYGAWRSIRVDSIKGGAVRALVPASLALDAGGGFRLLVHFHGADVVRKELAREGLGLVVAGVDLGVGSAAYARGFAAPGAFSDLVSAVERDVAERVGATSARASVIAVSSWSAGYGATGRILARPGDRDRVAGIVLLDSLYASYATGKREPDRAAIAPFLDVASSAAKGGAPFFFLAHSEIATSGYASTGEVASFLLRDLGLEQASSVERGNLVVRGYPGADAPAHCEALRFLPAVVRERIMTLSPAK